MEQIETGILWKASVVSSPSTSVTPLPVKECRCIAFRDNHDFQLVSQRFVQTQRES